MVSSRFRAPASPPYRACSSTCSDSGPTPSRLAAVSARSRTLRPSASASGPVTVTRGASSPVGGCGTGLLLGSRVLRGRGPRLRGVRGQAIRLGDAPVRLILVRRAAGPRAPSLVGALGRDEPVAHVAYRPDQRLVLGPELCPEPSYVHVHRAGAAEVVVAPDLLEQVGPGEYPSGVLGQELQQLEFLERQVEGAGPERGRVGGLIDSQVAGPDLIRGGRGRAGLPADGQPQPGLDLGGPGGGPNPIIRAPFGGHRGQPALGDHGQERDVQG